MKDRFFLYKRPRSRNWYVRYKLQNGSYSSGKSLFTANKSEAEYKVLRWLHDNIPISENTQNTTSINELMVNNAIESLKKANLSNNDANRVMELFKVRGLVKDFTTPLKEKTNLICFLNKFWDYDNSAYVQDKLSHGQKIGHRRCKEALSNIRNHWAPYFNNMKLEDLTRLNMQEFSIHLSNKSTLNKKGEVSGKKLSAASLNRIMGYGTVATAWAKRQGIIGYDPCDGLMRFSGEKKKRGILSDKEVQRLFKEGDWNGNEGAKLGNLLASQTGMRAGEIMALRIEDLKEDRICVSHSYSREEGGLKTTKTGEKREIPILPETRKLLLDHVKTFPYEINDETFIFFSTEKSDIPIGTETFLRRLREALESIGIKRSEQTERNITFHGWRHYYTRKMVDVLDQRTAKLTGHATQEMLDHYSNHANEEDFKKAAQATIEVFGKILPYSEKRKQTKASI